MQRISDLNFAAFAAPLTWREDDLGHTIHADINCAELHMTGRRIALTLKQALKQYRICSDCAERGDLAANGRDSIISAAVFLMEVERKIPNRRQHKIENPGPVRAGILLETPSLEILYSNFENEDLLYELEIVVLPDADVLNWKTRLVETIRNSDPIIVDAAGRDAEILHKAATEVLKKKLYDFENHPALAYQDEITSLFGEINGAGLHYSLSLNEKSHPVTELLQQWFISLHDGMTPGEARRKLSGAKWAVAGHSNADERTLLRRLLKDWQNRMDDLLAKKPAVLLCAAHPTWAKRHRRYGSGLGENEKRGRIHTVIVSSLNWIHGTDNSAVTCHPTLAEYAMSCSSEGSGSEAIYTAPIPLPEPLPDKDILDMLSLWNPHDNTSVYHTAEAALEASKLL